MSQNNESKPDYSETCSNYPITVEIRRSNSSPVSIRFGPGIGVLTFSITEQEAHRIADFLLHTGKGLYYNFEVGKDGYEIIWCCALPKSITYVVFERVDSNYPYQLTSLMATELSEVIERALSEFSSSHAAVEDSMKIAKKKTHENLRSVFG